MQRIVEKLLGSSLLDEHTILQEDTVSATRRANCISCVAMRTVEPPAFSQESAARRHELRYRLLLKTE